MRGVASSALGVVESARSAAQQWAPFALAVLVPHASALQPFLEQHVGCFDLRRQEAWPDVGFHDRASANGAGAVSSAAPIVAALGSAEPHKGTMRPDVSRGDCDGDEAQKDTMRPDTACGDFNGGETSMALGASTASTFGLALSESGSEESAPEHSVLFTTAREHGNSSELS